jgi:hypothetical protein
MILDESMEDEKGLLEVLRPWSVTTTLGCWLGRVGVGVESCGWCWLLLLLVTSARVDRLWNREERVILLQQQQQQQKKNTFDISKQEEADLDRELGV